MNLFDRLLDHWENRGVVHILTEEEVIASAKPLTSAIVRLTPYQSGSPIGLDKLPPKPDL